MKYYNVYIHHSYGVAAYTFLCKDAKEAEILAKSAFYREEINIMCEIDKVVVA